MSMTQHQQLYELWKKARLIKNKKTPESSRALEAKEDMLEVKTDNSSNESLFMDEKSKANNRTNSALDRRGSGTRQSQTDTWWSGPSKGDSQPSVLRNNNIQPLSTIHVTVAHALVASSKHKVDLDSCADTCVVGDNCWVFHDQNRPVNVHSYSPSHRSVKTVYAAVRYQDLQSRQKLILMINQVICINGLENHLLCPIECHLNGVHISEVPKFLAETPLVTTHAIKLPDSFDAAHPLVIPLKVSGVTRHFDLYSPSIADYDNEEIPWDP